MAAQLAISPGRLSGDGFSTPGLGCQGGVMAAERSPRRRAELADPSAALVSYLDDLLHTATSTEPEVEEPLPVEPEVDTHPRQRIQGLEKPLRRTSPLSRQHPNRKLPSSWRRFPLRWPSRSFASRLKT